MIDADRPFDVQQEIERLMGGRAMAATLCRLINQIAGYAPSIARDQITDLAALELSATEVARNALLLELGVLEHALPQIMRLMRKHLTDGGEIVPWPDVADVLGNTKH